MKTENLTREALTKFAAENREAFEALLKDFVEIPSISVDPTKKDAIRENAKLAADMIRAFGGEATILETDGHPIVSGTWGEEPRLADRHRLQPPRRPARLEGDGAVGDGALHLHEAGGPLLRPRHDRRQGARR